MTGIAWADLPRCYGKSNSVWYRYDLWWRTGVWQRIAAELRDGDTEWLCVDSSCVRATGTAAGAKKADGSGGRSSEALGRGCGGFATKIHAVVNPLGHPVVIGLTAAQCAAGPQLPGPIAGVETEAVLADKG